VPHDCGSGRSLEANAVKTLHPVVLGARHLREVRTASDRPAHAREKTRLVLRDLLPGVCRHEDIGSEEGVSMGLRQRVRMCGLDWGFLRCSRQSADDLAVLLFGERAAGLGGEVPFLTLLKGVLWP
jgi:hypothetical protein